MRRSLRFTGLRARFLRFSIVVAAAVGAIVVGPLTTSAKADDAGMMSFLLSGNAGNASSAHVRYVVDGPRAYYAPPPTRTAAAASISIRRKSVQARKAAKIRFARRHAIKLARVAPRARVSPVVALKAENFGPAVPPPVAIAAKAAAQVAPDVHFRDQTLRAGDIIATAKGLRVFQGAEHFPYRDSDFIALAKAGKKQHNAVLAALDLTIRGRRPVAPIAVRAQKPATLSADRAGGASPSHPLAYAPAAREAPKAPAVRAIERAIGAGASADVIQKINANTNSFNGLLVRFGSDRTVQN